MIFQPFVRSQKPETRRLERLCVHRSPKHGVWSVCAFTEARNTAFGAFVRSQEPETRRLERLCAHRSPKHGVWSVCALTGA